MYFVLNTLHIVFFLLFSGVRDSVEFIGENHGAFDLWCPLRSHHRGRNINAKDTVFDKMCCFFLSKSSLSLFWSDPALCWSSVMEIFSDLFKILIDYRLCSRREKKTF